MTPTEDSFAEKLRGFGPAGILAIVAIYFANIVFTPLSAILVLAWAKLSHTPWRDLGFVRPRSWIRTVLLAALFGVTFKLLMKSIVMPLLGAPPINQPFQFLVGNTAALPGIFYAVVIGAAFGEETLFRGFAFERLGKLVGETPLAKVLIVLATTALFAAEHYTLQGLPGVQQAAVVGLVFGSIFVVRRQIWFLIVAHAAFDLTAVAIIYFGLERQMAGLFFR